MASNTDHHPANMRAPSPAYSSTSNASTQRYAAPSNAQHGFPPPDNSTKAQKPVDEAVTTALNTAQAQTSTQISPDLIAQITQNVIQQLQQTGATAAAPPPASTTTTTTIHHPTPQSPSTTASASSSNMPDRVLTPPSPQRYPEVASHRSPPPTQAEQFTRGLHSPPVGSNYQPPRASSPVSYESDASEKEHPRPKGPARLNSAKEETTLERIWGPLFDEEGHATARLSQLLRGLALHIIEEYEPKNSLVITPDKMARYYQAVKLPIEAYPWLTVFDDEQTSISRMYRDLDCQHHLVQERHDQRPDIPGLTPAGFARWVTVLIQAHPDAEFDRLQKAVLEIPISNADDRKERFPKEISRRLFPLLEDKQIRYMIDDSISERAAIELPRRGSREDLPTRQESPKRSANPLAEAQNQSQPHRPSVSFADQVQTASAPAAQPAPKIERERKPYSSIPSESAIDDTNPPVTAPAASTMSSSIERERKPYSVQPGGGKQYEDDHQRAPPIPISTGNDRDTSRSRGEPSLNPTGPKPTRSDSNARSRPMSISQTRPMDIPKPEVHHHRAPSIATSTASSNAPPYRRRSPSFSRVPPTDYRRSEPDVRGHDQYASSTPRNTGEGFPDESDTRRYFEKQARDRAERARRDEDMRHYGESPRKTDPQLASSNRRESTYPPSDEEYHRSGGGGGRGYEYSQPYGGPVYR